MYPLNFYEKLNKEERVEFAKGSGCSIHHLRLNLFPNSGVVRKTPSPELLVKMTIQSNGAFTLSEAMNYFLIEPYEKAAKEMGYEGHLKSIADNKSRAA